MGGVNPFKNDIDLGDTDKGNHGSLLPSFLLPLYSLLLDRGNFAKVLIVKRLEDVIRLEITERMPLTPNQPSWTSI